MLRSLMLAAAAALVVVSGACAVAQTAAPAESAGKLAPAEVRGTWLTTTANDAISSPEKTAATMKRLREIGLNVVYVECWKDGYTEFPSPTMEKLVGVSMKVNAAPAALQRDLLLETSIEAQRNGMLAIGWFEYGFMAAWKDTDNALRRLGEKEGWLLRNKEGKVVGKQNSFVWMNPLHPKAQQIVLDVVLDAVKKYDLDGIQLDDRIAMPVDMGYDDFTKQLYASEHNGKLPPEDHRDPAWIQWRADKITEYARVFAREVRKANPNLIVSVSPAPYRWSLDNYACDWPKWVPWTRDANGGGWDEFVPQNYRFNYERTKASIEEQFPWVGDRRRDLIAGIRIVGDGPDMPEADLMKAIEFTRESGMGGHVHWFSRGVLDVYPEELKRFYNITQLGQAPHPARPADWRPMPVVGKPEARAEAGGTGSGRWVFEVAKSGKYRVIAKKSGRWAELGSFEAQAGRVVREIPDAEEAELLADRRP